MSRVLSLDVIKQALPSPVKVQRSGILAALRDMVGDASYKRLFTELGCDRKTKGRAVMDAIESPDGGPLRTVFASDGGHINIPSLEGFLAPMRYFAMNGRLFHIDESLNEQLANSDIGENCPVEFFKTPYSSIYLDFGNKNSVSIYNGESGIHHPMDGAYLTRLVFDESNVGEYSENDVVRDMGIKKGESFYVYEMLMVGSYIEEVKTDASNFLRMIIPVDGWDVPLGEFLDRQLDLYAKHCVGDTGDKVRASLKSGVFHIAKTLLYINMPDARLVEEKNRSEIEARLARIKGGKQKKLERRLERAYDRIVVGPPSGPRYAGHGDAHQIRRAHWRRGHFRSQPYGRMRMERKVIWIHPSLITGTGTASDGKTYDVV